jgi:hypothetical protein
LAASTGVPTGAGFAADMPCPAAAGVFGSDAFGAAVEPAGGRVPHAARARSRAMQGAVRARRDGCMGAGLPGGTDGEHIFTH